MITLYDILAGAEQQKSTSAIRTLSLTLRQALVSN